MAWMCQILLWRLPHHVRASSFTQIWHFTPLWTTHKSYPPIPHGHVIPILSAMQGHPEAPRLWEIHADKILHGIGLVPKTHEPRLYSGVIDNDRILLLRQVDDFSVAVVSQSITLHVFDLIDEQLTSPPKWLGLISLFNRIDVIQSQHCIKILCKASYIDRACDKYLDSWM